MKKLKSQKGITLIALVITIIVMMILVGVSVTVALNGGLFSTAQRATRDTEIASEREQLLSIAIGAINNKGKVDLDKLDEGILADGKFEKIGEGTETTRTYKNKKSENTYTIKQDASITLGNGLNDDETTAVSVGSYVRYNVTYKDVYSETMPKFTADNGWRYLGTDSEGNYLLVSTGIPAKLYYHYNDADTIGNKADRDDGKGNDWWATNAQITALPTNSVYYTDKGYIFAYNANSGYPNKYATYGMSYNFESIPFAKSSTATENAGCYKEIDSETTTVNGSVFRAPGYEDDSKVKIRILTSGDIMDTWPGSTGMGSYEGWENVFDEFDGAALGLFYLNDLPSYGPGTYYELWLANPVDAQYIRCSDHLGSLRPIGWGSSNVCIGIRPVVVLSSEFYDIVESETEGVYKIDAK